MEPAQFTLRRMLLASVWFSLLAALIASQIRFSMVAKTAAEQEQFVCGIGMPGIETYLLLVMAGLTALAGRYWTMAIFGLPGVCCCAPLFL